MTIKRITLFAGHYGSGKTNIAVNYAFRLKEEGKDVIIADLDIVNPYFRTKDSEMDFEEKGIKLICSEYANSNLDIPALPKEMYEAVLSRDSFSVMDIGGDDRGAFALGRYTPYILEENDYEMVFVANFYRPLTKNAEEALEVMREIEAAAGIKFTAIVNNSNLGEITTPEDVLKTQEEIEKLSLICGLTVLFTSVSRAVAEGMQDKDGLFILDLQKKYY